MKREEKREERSEEREETRYKGGEKERKHLSPKPSLELPTRGERKETASLVM